VRLYPAIAEHKLHFHLVHEKDESPIGYQKVCKLEDIPVPDAEVVKAFEYRKGEYVPLSDEDFELARARGGRAIEISDFVPLADIDPILFARPYYVGPGAGGEKVYALLARAMEEAGLAAVVTFVMRDQQHLGALRVADGLIVLEQLRFADEQRPVEGIKPTGQRVSRQELEMAAKLIESYRGPWRPEKYKDTYRAELCALIEAKRKGTAPPAPARAEEEQPADLMEALRRSIQAGPARSRKAPARRRASSTARGARARSRR
jgi:DNA end-binding protein Ku